MENCYCDTFSPTLHINTIRLIFDFCSYMWKLYYPLFKYWFCISLPQHCFWRTFLYVFTSRNEFTWRHLLESFKSNFWNITCPSIIADQITEVFNLYWVHKIKPRPRIFYRRENNATELIFFHVADLIIWSLKFWPAEIVEKLQKIFAIHQLRLSNENFRIQVNIDTNCISIPAKESIADVLK